MDKEKIKELLDRFEKGEIKDVKELATEAYVEGYTKGFNQGIRKRLRLES